MEELGQTHLLYRLLGQKIAARRQGLLTQAQLAAAIGVSRTSVTNLENGRQHPPLHQLVRIAEALDCELVDLLPSRADLALSTGPRSFEELRIVGELTPAAKRFVIRETKREG